MPTSPPQVRVPDQGADAHLAEHVGQHVAARAGHLVDEQHLRAPDGGVGRGERLAVAHRVVEVAQQLAVHDVDHQVGDGAAVVVALVDHGALLVLLGEVVAHEGGIAAVAGVRYPDVGELAAGQLVDAAAVVLDPGPLAQRFLVGDGHDGHLARALQFGFVVERQDRLAVGLAVEQAVGAHVRRELDAVDREQEVADARVDAGAAQGRPQLRVPVLARVDPAQAVAAVRHLEVAAQQTDGTVSTSGSSPPPVNEWPMQVSPPRMSST